uniref:Calcineurin-like phosphoesterase n=1 Tax=Pseudomonas phage Nican01 TaxID=3138540 RepID=A0AAU6W070_9CAUD
MKPYGVISDVHCHSWSQFSRINPDGVNSRLQDILDALEMAAKHVLNSEGDTLYITGDLFHVRGSVSPKVLNPVKNAFTKQTGKGLKIVVLTGNHDLESRDSEALSNACEALSPIPGVTIVSKPRIFHDDYVVMVPWYDSLDTVRKHIADCIEEIEDLGDEAASYTLMLHAPVNGVLFGIPDHGFYAKELEKLGFARVFSGHFHNHKQFEGEVYSVGALTHQTWGDVKSLAGHIIVDDTGVHHFKNNSPQFKDFDLGWDDDTAAEECKGSFVRVRLGEADSDEIEMIRDHILGLGAIGCNVDAIPVPKGTATARPAPGTPAPTAPTVRQSVTDWIRANSAASTQPEVEKLCMDILTEVESITV